MVATMGLAILWKGITLGLGAAAPIGPVNVEIARRAVRWGFWPGFLLGLGAVTVDVGYVVLASFSVRLFLDRPRIMLGMGVAGGSFLIFLGIESLRKVMRQWAEPQAQEGAPPLRRNYLTGLVMTALNPMTLAFWFFAPQMTGVKQSGEMPWLVSGVAMGTLSWVCFFAMVMSAAGKKFKQRAVAAANLAGGITLIGFGGRAIWQVVRPYL